MLSHFSFYAGVMDIGERLKLLSLMQGMSSDVVVAATAVGDTSTLRDFLTKHPEEVHTLAGLMDPFNLPFFSSVRLFYTPKFTQGHLTPSKH